MAVGPVLANNGIYADGILSNLSIAYKNEVYIADSIFPEVQVKDRTGIYFKYGKDKFGTVNSVRAPGTVAQVVDYSLQQATYGPLLDHSLDARIPDEITSMAAAPLDPAFDATEMLSEKLSVDKEVDAFNQMSNTSVITQNVTLSGTSRWDDYANSDPINDLRVAIDAVKKSTIKATGQLTIVLGYEVYSVLRNHPQFLERMKYSQLGITTTELIAQILGVKNVVIAEAESNSANQGQSASMGYVWGKNAWVVLVAERPAPRTVSFGYTLRMGSRRVLRMRDDRAETDYIRVKDYYQQMIMAADAGYFLASVVN